ncbi:145R protein [Yaba-like disease virus]|uniref:145R protein n=1 Tax=Yaba-like disease virus TaxID=132475 RepID=Q9DHG8_YLDV|nr:145R protein [Yaba-like disease virus]CAC21383.1 145R protein [Yaba-like disease virus]
METTVFVDNYSYYFEEECDFEMVNSDVNYFVIVFYILLFIFGLIGNVLVIAVLIVKRFMFVVDVYLFNIAMSDLMLVFSFPFIIHNDLNEWIFGEFMCKLVLGVYFVGFFSNMFFVTLISIDRYILVVNATKIKNKSISLSVLLSVAAWVCSVFLSMPAMVLYYVDNTDNLKQCIFNDYHENFSWSAFFNFEINIFGIVIPLIILIYCYSKILYTLKNCKNKNKTRSIKIILTVVLFTVVFWVPFNIVLFINSLQSVGLIDIGCYHLKKIVYSIDIAELISFVHCCVNPIIYAFVGKNFKKVFKNMFCRTNNIFIRQSSNNVI